MSSCCSTSAPAPGDGLPAKPRHRGVVGMTSDHVRSPPAGGLQAHRTRTVHTNVDRVVVGVARAGWRADRRQVRAISQCRDKGHDVLEPVKASKALFL